MTSNPSNRKKQGRPIRKLLYNPEHFVEKKEDGEEKRCNYPKIGVPAHKMHCLKDVIIEANLVKVRYGTAYSAPIRWGRPFWWTPFQDRQILCPFMVESVFTWLLVAKRFKLPRLVSIKIVEWVANTHVCHAIAVKKEKESSIDRYRQARLFDSGARTAKLQDWPYVCGMENEEEVLFAMMTSSFLDLRNFKVSVQRAADGEGW